MNVDEEERILRRVLPYWHSEVEKTPERGPPPRWTDFKPNKNDIDGISVTRRKFVVDLAIEAGSGQRRSLAEVKVRDVIKEGMTVKPDPLLNLPGHALIPELNRRDYDGEKKDKIKIQEWALKLARDYAIIVYSAPKP